MRSSMMRTTMWTRHFGLLFRVILRASLGLEGASGPNSLALGACAESSPKLARGWHGYGLR